MKKALVCGAGGFIGGHLVKRLKREGFWVRGVDLKFHEYAETEADDFVVGDLRDMNLCRSVIDTRYDEVYQLAADMGGAGFIFTGENDADIMHNSATINQLVDMVADIAGKKIEKNHIPGPQGVRGRNSDNHLIREKLDWAPSQALRTGLETTFAWIEAQVRRNSKKAA